MAFSELHIRTDWVNQRSGKTDAAYSVFRVDPTGTATTDPATGAVTYSPSYMHVVSEEVEAMAELSPEEMSAQYVNPMLAVVNVRLGLGYPHDALVVQQ